jgi:hypothetical protein
LIALASLVTTVGAGAEPTSSKETAPMPIADVRERQVTHEPCGHILTNAGVWSPDSRWLVYDVRSDLPGADFDGSRIEAVNADSGEVRLLYQSQRSAHCGVVTWHPHQWKVVFIHGPENPSPEWQYGFSHRQGVIVDWSRPNVAIPLDARDLTPPFTPGALRGGSHVHRWDAAGEWVSFTYNDALVEPEIRDIAVSVPDRPVKVHKDHPRNHDSQYFTALVSRTTAKPKPGSDEIQRACEEAWVGAQGYLRADGSRQRHALAFEGNVIAADGKMLTEVFLLDLPDDLGVAGEGPLAGSQSRRPAPPKGVVQRRLTFTAERKYPGLQGPRHWLQSSCDGSRIACVMKDDDGVAQLWIVSPCGGPPRQLTHNPWPIASAFTWSPDGRWLAYVADNSVFLTRAADGESFRVTPRSPDAQAPHSEACVFSPDGNQLAYLRSIETGKRSYNQVFVVSFRWSGT